MFHLYVSSGEPREQAESIAKEHLLPLLFVQYRCLRKQERKRFNHSGWRKGKVASCPIHQGECHLRAPIGQGWYAIRGTLPRRSASIAIGGSHRMCMYVNNPA